MTRRAPVTAPVFFVIEVERSDFSWRGRLAREAERTPARRETPAPREGVHRDGGVSAIIPELHQSAKAIPPPPWTRTIAGSLSFAGVRRNAEICEDFDCPSVIWLAVVKDRADDRIFGIGDSG
jgi:hypothetical protein